MFSFDPTKIDWENQIGHGSFGTIYPYRKTPEDERFVVKYGNISNASQLNRYIQEIVLGFSCKHENFLPVRGYFINYDQIKKRWDVYIKLDRMKCSLKSRIVEQRQKNQHFSQKEIINYFYEISCGLEYLHSQRIAHRDITPANILISQKEETKIADFGVGKFVGEEDSSMIGTMAGTSCYMAPEMLQQDASHLKKEDLFKADIWSLGIVMTELCLLKVGVVDMTKSRSENEDNIVKKLKELKEKIYDEALLDLIASACKSDPKQRKSLQDIQNTLREKYGNLLKSQDKQILEIEIQNERSLIANQEFGEGDINKILQMVQKDLTDFKEKFKSSFKINYEGFLKAEIGSYLFKNFTERGFEELTQEIGLKLKYVQNLSLNFINCQNITNDGFKELAQQIGLYLKNIQNLSLNFINCLKITDDGVKELAQQIGSNLKNIQRFYVQLEG